MNNSLIKVNKKDLGINIDLKYATNDNFTKTKLLKKSECYIHKIAYEHLTKPKSFHLRKELK